MMKEVNAATERLRRWSSGTPTGTREGDAGEDQQGAEGQRQACGLVENEDPTHGPS
jgi:hypothetical protein